MVEGVIELCSKPLSSMRYKVIETIDRFGAITMEQLSRFLFDMNWRTVHRGKNQGIELGYVQERPYGLRKLLSITDFGAQFIGKNLKGVSLNNNDLYHQLISNEVLLKFIFEYRDQKGFEVFYMTERDIITERQTSMPASELKKPNRAKYLYKKLPDFTLTINGKVMAFEIEISRKMNNRIEDKVKKYKINSDYDAVYYVCGNDYIYRSVKKVSDDLNAGIHFLMLDDVINPMEV